MKKMFLMFLMVIGVNVALITSTDEVFANEPVALDEALLTPSLRSTADTKSFILGNGESYSFVKQIAVPRGHYLGAFHRVMTRRGTNESFGFSYAFQNNSNLNFDDYNYTKSYNMSTRWDGNSFTYPVDTVTITITNYSAGTVEYMAGVNFGLDTDPSNLYFSLGWYP